MAMEATTETTKYRDFDCIRKVRFSPKVSNNIRVSTWQTKKRRSQDTSQAWAYENEFKTGSLFLPRSCCVP